jgi:hypothetical protein
MGAKPSTGDEGTPGWFVRVTALRGHAVAPQRLWLPPTCAEPRGGRYGGVRSQPRPAAGGRVCSGGREGAGAEQAADAK